MLNCGLQDKDGAAGFSETLQATYKSTRYYNPDDCNPNFLFCENLRTRISTSMPLFPRPSLAVKLSSEDMVSVKLLSPYPLRISHI
jgi:hypothetical protein